MIDRQTSDRETTAELDVAKQIHSNLLTSPLIETGGMGKLSGVRGLIETSKQLPSTGRVVNHIQQYARARTC